MTGRLALLTLAGALCACDAPPQPPAPVAPAAAPPAVQLSSQQIEERSEQCDLKAREAYLRDASQVGVAEFESHYSVGLDTCFYLLTTVRQDLIGKKLIDIYEGETYGEYAGSATNWLTCRVGSLHCASLREWDVLAEPYMTN